MYFFEIFGASEGLTWRRWSTSLVEKLNDCATARLLNENAGEEHEEETAETSLMKLEPKIISGMMI